MTDLTCVYDDDVSHDPLLPLSYIDVSSGTITVTPGGEKRNAIIGFSVAVRTLEQLRLGSNVSIRLRVDFLQPLPIRTTCYYRKQNDFLKDEID